MRADSPSTQTVTALARAAAAAPSLHNAQPWRLRYLREAATFQLHAALDRCLPHADPNGRALHLGCGAALFNLRVAAARAGWRSAGTLLPDPFDPRLLATVRLDPGPDPDAQLAALAPAIPSRRSSRQPFATDPVPGPVRAALARAARQEGAALAFPPPGPLLAAVADAEGRGPACPAGAAEPAEAAAPGAPGGPDFAARPAPGAPQEPAAAEPPQLAVLTTESDRPADRLRAGQALERVLLLATRHGVATGLSAAPEEWAPPFGPAAEALTGPGRAHAVLRLGYGPPVPATERHPVSQVLTLA